MGNVVTYTFQDNHNAWHMTSFMPQYSMTPIVTNLQWHKTHAKMLLAHLIWLVYFLPIRIIAYILQWHTGVYEENFDVNIKIAQASQLNIWNFIVGKSSLHTGEMANFMGCSGDFTL